MSDGVGGGLDVTDGYSNGWTGTHTGRYLIETLADPDKVHSQLLFMRIIYYRIRFLDLLVCTILDLYSLPTGLLSMSHCETLHTCMYNRLL